MLFCMWAVVAPALVEERTGVFGAFGRSRELTKGARWKVFGLELILLVAMWIVTLMFGLLILRTNNAEALAQNAVSVGWIVGSAVLNTLIYTVWGTRSEEHTSELQSLMRISYAVFCLKKKKNQR